MVYSNYSINDSNFRFLNLSSGYKLLKDEELDLQKLVSYLSTYMGKQNGPQLHINPGHHQRTHYYSTLFAQVYWEFCSDHKCDFSKI